MKNTDRNIMLLLNNSSDGRKRMLSDESVSFDESTHTLHFVVATSIDQNYRGSTRKFVREAKTVDLSTLIDKTVSDA